MLCGSLPCFACSLPYLRTRSLWLLDYYCLVLACVALLICFASSLCFHAVLDLLDFSSFVLLASVARVLRLLARLLVCLSIAYSFARLVVDLLGDLLLPAFACATTRRENATENFHRKAKLVVGEIRPDQAGVYQDLRGVVPQVSGFYYDCQPSCIAEVLSPFR